MRVLDPWTVGALDVRNIRTGQVRSRTITAPPPDPPPPPPPTGGALVKGASIYDHYDQVFGRSVYKRSIPSNAPLHTPGDPKLAGRAIAAQQGPGGNPSWNATVNVAAYNLPCYVVDSTVPYVATTHRNARGFGSVDLWGNNLQTLMAQVRIPAGATPAPGTDSSMSIYDVSNDRMVDLWIAKPPGFQGFSNWSWEWAARTDNVTTKPGVHDSGSVVASCLWGVAFQIGYTEAERAMSTGGVVPHAIGLELPRCQGYGGTDPSQLSWPARHTDATGGNNGAGYQGQVLRLDPGLNVNSMNLTPFAKMVARTAQVYGFIPTDTSGAVAIRCEPQPGGESGPRWGGLWQGKASWQILDGFPWSHFIAIQKDWGKP